MARLLRFAAAFGPMGKIPVGHTMAYQDYIKGPGKPEHITGTKIERINPVPLGIRAIAFDEAEIDDRVERLKEIREQWEREPRPVARSLQRRRARR